MSSKKIKKNKKNVTTNSPILKTLFIWHFWSMASFRPLGPSKWNSLCPSFPAEILPLCGRREIGRDSRREKKRKRKRGSFRRCHGQKQRRYKPMRIANVQGWNTPLNPFNACLVDPMEELFGGFSREDTIEKWIQN